MKKRKNEQVSLSFLPIGLSILEFPGRLVSSEWTVLFYSLPSFFSFFQSPLFWTSFLSLVILGSHSLWPPLLFLFSFFYSNFFPSFFLYSTRFNFCCKREREKRELRSSNVERTQNTTKFWAWNKTFSHIRVSTSIAFTVLWRTQTR